MLPGVNRFLAASIDGRERALVAMFRNIRADGVPERAGACCAAATRLDDFAAHGGWRPQRSTRDAARLRPTRLKAQTRAAQQQIIEGAYALADPGLHSFVIQDAPAPTGPPLSSRPHVPAASP
jgi:hypothetical protein